ncbi:Ferredoxin, 2Fe-2S [Rhodococcus sp. B7740]|nr:Ferredoxin, 2Fe-2S [Rhodococcus sp. B7740]
MRQRMTLKQALDSLESASFLDGASNAINDVLEPALDDSTVGGALRGQWIGHPIHPALVNVTIGSWTSAVALDLLNHQSRASKLVISIGLVSAPAAIATGWADWSTMNTRQRRVGIIHAASNATGVFLFLGSYLRRRKQTDGIAKALAAAGLATASVGGLIGGHLAYSSTEQKPAPAGKPSLRS